MGRDGVLLMNVGTPDEPTIASVKTYLREFLLDPDVIDIPAPLRHLLVRGSFLELDLRKLHLDTKASGWKEAPSSCLHTENLRKTPSKNEGNSMCGWNAIWQSKHTFCLGIAQRARSYSCPTRTAVSSLCSGYHRIIRKACVQRTQCYEMDSRYFGTRAL